MLVTKPPAELSENLLAAIITQILNLTKLNQISAIYLNMDDFM